MKKIHILFGISILIIMGVLITPDKTLACVNYAFNSSCQTSYYQSQYSYNNDYTFNHRNNYAFRSVIRYRYDYAFSDNNHKNYYPKYAFYSHGY